MRIGVVVLVVGVGLAIALQFRKQGGAAESSFAVAPTAANESANKAPAAAQDMVPFRSTSLDHLGETTANPAATATESSSAPAASSEVTDSGSSSGAGKSGMVDLNAPDQTHKIVDGDTLPQLAQQYLGRADRYMQIFDYNRDVLQSPDVLPIGAELRIPSRLALTAGEDGSTKSSAAPTAVSTAPPAAPLVPLIAPTAKPAVAAKKPRTYTVERGDNLVDIARKMYGDGRKHQDLYEANRGVMHNPGDLQPGMVLVIP